MSEPIAPPKKETAWERGLKLAREVSSSIKYLTKYLVFATALNSRGGGVSRLPYKKNRGVCRTC